MKQITKPINQDTIDTCSAMLRKALLDGDRELVIRDIRVGKTLAQLGTLFGLWMRDIEKQSGGSWTIQTLHNHLKHKFLVGIYQREQEGPSQQRQAEWVEHLELLLETGDIQRVMTQIQRISLSWASKNQHSEYLEHVWHWAIDEGFNLTIPDRYRDVWRPDN